MRKHTSRRGRESRALIERMEERCLLSAALPNGTANAMAYDASGRLWVAYYDNVDRDLKYGLRNADGTWAVQGGVIDEGLKGANDEDTPADRARVGEYVSMVIEREGAPGVAYFDAYWSNLKYAHYNAATQQWDVEHVDANGRVGMYASIAYAPVSGVPAISYFSTSAGQMRLTQRNATGWGGSTTPTSLYDVVDGSDTAVVGRYSVLALAPAGRWAIGYDDSANGAAKYAFQGKGNGWNVRTADASPVSDVAFTGMAFDSTGRPALSYYDSYDADAMFARADATDGATWQSTRIAGATNTAGKYTNLMYDGATDRFTVYYNQESGSNPIKINYRTGNIGATWTAAQTLYTGGGSESRVIPTPGVAGGLTYSWSAADGSGANTLYVNDTTTGTVWTQETGDAGFNGRIYRAGATVHTYNGQSKIYVIGGTVDTGSVGADAYNLSNLVRASADGGATWTSWAPQAAGGGPIFAGRDGEAVVSFQGKLWVIAGFTGSGWQQRDVWSSADGGATWTRGPDLPAGFAARSNLYSAVSTDGSTLYLIGGSTPTQYLSDVWSTTDGQTWTQRTAAAPFGGRYGASVAYFNDRLWVMGGAIDGSGENNDVWSSADGGATWTEATAAQGAARFTTRLLQHTVVQDNRMWVIGGSFDGGGTNAFRNDVWYSFDGANWTLATSNQGDAFKRTKSSAVSFGGRIVLMFGENWTMKNDVWSAG